MNGQRYSGNPGSAVPLHHGDVNPNQPPYGQRNVPGWSDSQLQAPYGLQQLQTWRNRANDKREMLNMKHAPHLWKVCIFGSNLIVDIDYGTKATKRLTGLLTPVQLFMPGQVSVTAYPRLSDEGIPLDADCQVSVTLATSGKEASARLIIGGAQALSVDAFRYFALTASVLNIGAAAIPVNLNPLDSVALVEGSFLISGDGYLEFDT